MKKRFVYIFFGIAAIMLTSLGYLVDNDPPYADFKMTILEFSVITVVIFGLLSFIYLIGKFLVNLIGRLA